MRRGGEGERVAGRGGGGDEAGRENRARAAMCIPLRRIIWGYSKKKMGFLLAVQNLKCR